jgi:DNA-binding response OmpR family regulator
VAGIVVVEDDADIRDLIEMFLVRAGHDVRCARHGREGLDLCVEQPPDLVVLDVMMPVMSGLEVAARLRADPALTPVPIVMLSAGGREAEREAGISSGADLYLTKPFRLAELLDAVNTLLAGRPR